MQADGRAGVKPLRPLPPAARLCRTLQGPRRMKCFCPGMPAPGKPAPFPQRCGASFFLPGPSAREGQRTVFSGIGLFRPAAPRRMKFFRGAFL